MLRAALPRLADTTFFCIGKPAVQLYRDCAWACSGAALVSAGTQKRAHGYRKRAAVLERNGI